MRAQEKAQVLAVVAASPLSAREVLRSLGVAEATYYRWKRRLSDLPPENESRSSVTPKHGIEDTGPQKGGHSH
jgi:transposase